MQKSVFLYEVRQRIANKSAEALKKSLIEFARHIPRSDYDDALSLLEDNAQTIIDKNNTDLLSAVQEICNSVNNGEYDFSWELEDRYGYYGYWDDDILTDCGGLGEQVEILLAMSVAYVREKRYAQALQAFDAIFSIEAPMDDYDDINIMTLFSNSLIALDETEVLRYYAYAALMSLHGGERVQKLYDIASITSYKIELNAITLLGDDEIPDCEMFAEQWIEFLLKQNLHHFYENIIIDAVKYSGGTNALRKFTDEHGVRYQIAYIELITMYMAENQYQDAIDVSLDGLSKLDTINGRRTKIADLLLEVGKITNNERIAKTAIWEGFKSSLDLEHFLNLHNLKDDTLTGQAIQYLDNSCKEDTFDNHFYIHFLNRDYEPVWNACKNDKKFLGWSSSVKGKMLPLFIALSADEQNVMPCTKETIRSGFTHEDIFDNFIQLLESSMKNISDDERQKYFEWCVHETSGRVDAIIQGKLRGSYYKASALVVSLAEVIRSKNSETEAVSFIKRYKEKYPRHIAFHSCLRDDILLGGFGKII